MKRLTAYISIILITILPVTSHASIWKSLLKAAWDTYGVNLDIKNFSIDQLDQLKSLNGSLTGTHSYGSRYYDDKIYDWGSHTDSWQHVLSLARNGGGSGELGETIISLAKEFPMTGSLNSKNQVENDYYKLQAQTALSSRSASEVAYQQAIREEKNMKKLHHMIDYAADEKSAADLNNRFSSEQAFTSVQQMKLLAILVQQQAVNSQERANRAREDMEFFDVQ